MTVHCAYDQFARVADLKPNPKNPNTPLNGPCRAIAAVRTAAVIDGQKAVFDMFKSGRSLLCHHSFAARRAPSAARFFPALQNGFTGVFPTHPAFKAQTTKNWRRTGKCETPSRPKSRRFARPYRRETTRRG